MLKHLFTGFLLSAFLMVNSNAATNNSLKEAFDSFNYAVKVEWDQKDQGFYEQQVKTLNSKLDSLRAQGVSNDEILNYSLDSIKDKNLAKELRTTLSLAHIGKLSKVEVQDLVMKALKKSNAVGASWNSEDPSTGAILIVVGVIAAIAVIVALVFTERCPEGTHNTVVGSQEQCGYETVCYPDPWGDTRCGEEYRCRDVNVTECLPVQ